MKRVRNIKYERGGLKNRRDDRGVMIRSRGLYTRVASTTDKCSLYRVSSCSQSQRSAIC